MAETQDGSLFGESPPSTEASERVLGAASQPGSDTDETEAVRPARSTPMNEPPFATPTPAPGASTPDSFVDLAQSVQYRAPSTAAVAPAPFADASRAVEGWTDRAILAARPIDLAAELLSRRSTARAATAAAFIDPAQAVAAFERMTMRPALDASDTRRAAMQEYLAAGQPFLRSDWKPTPRDVALLRDLRRRGGRMRQLADLPPPDGHRLSDGRHKYCGWIAAGGIADAEKYEIKGLKTGINTFSNYVHYFDAIHPVWFQIVSPSPYFAALKEVNNPDVMAQRGVVDLIPTVAAVKTGPITPIQLVKILRDYGKDLSAGLVAMTIDQRNDYRGLDLDFEGLPNTEEARVPFLPADLYQ